MSGDFTNLGISPGRKARLLVLLFTVHAPATLAALQVIAPVFPGSPTWIGNSNSLDMDNSVCGVASATFNGNRRVLRDGPAKR